MARQYLRLGDQRVDVTDEQRKRLEQNRWSPAKLNEVKLAIFTEAGFKPEAVQKLMGQSVATS